jgi:CubicO group peptidase (beta-lactamase class C family)
MTPDLLPLWLSAAKPLTAMAVARLWDAGVLDLDEPVARHLPEFARAGKERITPRHLLTHTGGFRTRDIGLLRSWEENLARVCAAPLEPGWAPGARTAYQPASSWLVLGEVLQRVTGEPFQRHIRERVLLPLGMDESWPGMTPEVYGTLRYRLAPLYRTGVPGGGWRPYPWDGEPYATRASPAENAWGPARDLGCFYEALLEGGRGVLSPAATAALTTPVAAEGTFDESLQRVVHWGLGVRINGPAAGGPSGAGEMGRHASTRSFGHGGFRSSLAFADPEHGLVLVLIANGLPDGGEHRKRVRTVAEAVYADLGVAGR